MNDDKLKTFTKIEELRSFLVKNIDKLDIDGSSGGSLSFPTFDLFARDYLLFAEHELIQLKKNLTDIEHINLINCVSHLRRAIDCQLDTCFEILKIKVFKEKNLSLNAKLKFFEDAGVFNSFSLSRFNTVRNKMEHSYQIPKIEDIEAYFDLVSAFISILESMLSIICNFSEVTLKMYDDELQTYDYFSIGYSFDEIPNISYQITKSVKLVYMQDYDNSELYFEESSKLLKNWPEPSIDVKVTVKDRVDFPYFFKVLLLLARKDSFVSDKFILSELKK